MFMNYKITQNQSDSKLQLRKRFLAKRRSLEKSFVEQTSRIITKKLLIEIKKIKFSSVLVYLSVNNEVETKAIIDYLIKDGKRIFLPKYLGDTSEVSYVFAEFTGWQNLEKGPYGILQPSNEQDNKPGLENFYKPGLKEGIKDSFGGDLETAIIPGVAFDKRGVRLGYGKGVFDKLLLNSKAFKIGLAYDFQIVDKLPKEAHDLIMDLIVTEKRVICL